MVKLEGRSRGKQPVTSAGWTTVIGATGLHKCSQWIRRPHQKAAPEQYLQPARLGRQYQQRRQDPEVARRRDATPAAILAIVRGAIETAPAIAIADGVGEHVSTVVTTVTAAATVVIAATITIGPVTVPQHVGTSQDLELGKKGASVTGEAAAREAAG